MSKNNINRQVMALLLAAVVVGGVVYGQTATGGTDVMYDTVIIGGQTWMKKNLNIETEGSWCYENKAKNCTKYGRLYTWYAAKKVCPMGWHLPNYEEWQTLVDYVGGDDVAGKKLKAKSGWAYVGNGTDDYGWSALPGGSRNFDDTFYTAGYYGFWWTSEEHSDGSAYRRSMYCYHDNLDVVTDDKNTGLSVRCIAGENPNPTQYYWWTIDDNE